jgi:hypothetical protein
MSVKISGTLPTDDRNGLGPIARPLVDDPESVHVVVALVSCKTITTDIDSGDVVPTARIRAIEAFTAQTADAKELRRLWRRQMERRTGQVELPLEIEQELDSLTAELDRQDEQAPTEGDAES